MSPPAEISCFHVDSSTAFQKRQSIFRLDTSNDAIRSKAVPLGEYLDFKFHQMSVFSKISEIWPWMGKPFRNDGLHIWSKETAELYQQLLKTHSLRLDRVALRDNYRSKCVQGFEFINSSKEDYPSKSFKVTHQSDASQWLTNRFIRALIRTVQLFKVKSDSTVTAVHVNLTLGDTIVRKCTRG